MQLYHSNFVTNAEISFSMDSICTIDICTGDLCLLMLV